MRFDVRQTPLYPEPAEALAAIAILVCGVALVACYRLLGVSGLLLQIAILIAALSVLFLVAAALGRVWANSAGFPFVSRPEALQLRQASLRRPMSQGLMALTVVRNLLTALIIAELSRGLPFWDVDPAAWLTILAMTLALTFMDLRRRRRANSRSSNAA